MSCAAGGAAVAVAVRRTASDRPRRLHVRRTWLAQTRRHLRRVIAEAAPASGSGGGGASGAARASDGGASLSGGDPVNRSQGPGRVKRRTAVERGNGVATAVAEDAEGGGRLDGGRRAGTGGRRKVRAVKAASETPAAASAHAKPGAPRAIPRRAPGKKRTVRKLKDNAAVAAAEQEIVKETAKKAAAAPVVSEERQTKELAAAVKFKRMANKISELFDADGLEVAWDAEDAMQKVGLGFGSTAKVKKFRESILGEGEEQATDDTELVPRTMLQEVTEARRKIDGEAKGAAKEEDSDGGANAATLSSASTWTPSNPDETPGQRLKRLFREKRERGLQRVREKFSNLELFDELAGPAPGNEGGNSGSDSDDNKWEQSEAIFGEAARASQANKEALEEAGGGIGSSSPLLEGGKGLSANNSIDPFKLIPGEFVVHRKYGIGKYVGIRSIEMAVEMGADGKPTGKPGREGFLFIQYQDQLVKIKPAKAAKQLYRFASPGAIKAGVKPPKLSRIGDAKGWQNKEAKTRQHIRQLVVNQMCVYLQRLQCVRQPYQPPSDEVYQRFNDIFPFTLTPDQAMAINDCYEDLSQRDTPMDRLVVGDVGFGKTEVAMRAVFRVFAGGGQVFMLAPTTVLAKQHAATLAARLRPFGAQVELLNRNVKESTRNEVLQRWKRGETQVVVGTHLLLNLPPEMYGRLKLLVIDEEQRFGVKHKDKISALKSSVDVLTLSATPIPRTLHMAIAGFRDASLVTTPPPERRPIVTTLQPYDSRVVYEAIQSELDRDGQVFYIVPKIQMIEGAMKRIQAIFPDLRVMVGDGDKLPPPADFCCFYSSCPLNLLYLGFVGLVSQDFAAATLHVNDESKYHL